MRGFDSRSGLIMKKTAFLLVAPLVFLCTMYFVLSTPHAQTFDFNRAYQDYQYNLTLYNQAYSDYQDAKNAYLQGGKTLQLQEVARVKTLAMLRERDTLIAVYLTALRLKIVETAGLSTDDKNNIFGKIDLEVKWYQNHLGSYTDGDTLDTLFTKSDEAQTRYTSATTPIIYESLFDVSLGAEIGFREDQETIYSNLKVIISAGVASGKLNINPFNRWYADIDSVITIIKQNETTARTQIQALYGQYYSASGSYNTATDTLSSSLTSLSQLNNFLTEVQTSLKNQQ